jgi:hypothetical protein
MSTQDCLACPAVWPEAPMQSRLRRQGARKVVSLSLIRGKPRLARSKLAATSSRQESVGCSAAVGSFARVASRLPGGGSIRGDSRRASLPRLALPNPSLESRPSEAVRLARATASAIIGHAGKSACLSGPAQLERWAA